MRRGVAGVGCGSNEPAPPAENVNAPAEPPPCPFPIVEDPSLPTDAHLSWEGMERLDEETRRRFRLLEPGMTEDQVLDVMRLCPAVEREDHWVYYLSPASDTGTEINHRLHIWFEDGVVKSTKEDYACIYVEPDFD